MSWHDPRAIFAYLYLVIVGILTVAIALGRVEPMTSYGLDGLIVLLVSLGQPIVKMVSELMKERINNENRQ